MPKLIKSKPIQPLYTRGGTPILDGFDPLGPGAPTNTPFPTEIQNPNQLEPSQIRGAAGAVGIGRGRANAGPARSGAFGYAVRSRSFEQYNAPIINPRSQEPGAPISNRPIVPIGPGEGVRGQGGGGRGTGRGGGFAGREPSVRDITTAPESSNVGFRGASLGGALASVGVRATSVSGSTASTAGRVTVSGPRATAPVAPKPATPAATTTNKTTSKKAGKSGSLAAR